MEDVADSSPYGVEESWPPSDTSFTENTADQGERIAYQQVS